MMYASWCIADQNIYIYMLYIPENITEVSSVFTSYFTCTDEMPNLTFSMYNCICRLIFIKISWLSRQKNNSGKQIN